MSLRTIGSSFHYQKILAAKLPEHPILHMLPRVEAEGTWAVSCDRTAPWAVTLGALL